MKNTGADRAWADEAIRKVTAENNRSADTHLYLVPLPEHWGVQLYLKDESTHRSGSLKHRLARTTGAEKIALIEQFGGSCLLLDHASEVQHCVLNGRRRRTLCGQLLQPSVAGRAEAGPRAA